MVSDANKMEFRDDGHFYFEGNKIDVGGHDAGVPADGSGSGGNAVQSEELADAFVRERAGAAGVGNTTLRRAALVSAFVNAENGLEANEQADLSGDQRESSLPELTELDKTHSQGLRSRSDRLLSAVVNRANTSGFKNLFYQSQNAKPFDGNVAESEIAVFDSTQIKSATGNSGA